MEIPDEGSPTGLVGADVPVAAVVSVRRRWWIDEDEKRAERRGNPAVAKSGRPKVPGNRTPSVLL
jgi:hypothetical protein